ncbi:hypothetical protein OUZ56_027549 [Daphnia magna]|uniref:Uncharacterized protein n=1 Tax=Daphnia magna TaxID=35525 RepID=A0ABQ9ZQ26_9CRUS|nr:hypothetical protein OUZ56_027549 [Daphnia magna]
MLRSSRRLAAIDVIDGQPVVQPRHEQPRGAGFELHIIPACIAARQRHMLLADPGAASCASAGSAAQQRGGPEKLRSVCRGTPVSRNGSMKMAVRARFAHAQRDDESDRADRRDIPRRRPVHAPSALSVSAAYSAVPPKIADAIAWPSPTPSARTLARGEQLGFEQPRDRV